MTVVTFRAAGRTGVARVAPSLSPRRLPCPFTDLRPMTADPDRPGPQRPTPFGPPPGGDPAAPLVARIEALAGALRVARRTLGGSGLRPQEARDLAARLGDVAGEMDRLRRQLEAGAALAESRRGPG